MSEDFQIDKVCMYYMNQIIIYIYSLIKLKIYMYSKFVDIYYKNDICLVNHVSNYLATNIAMKIKLLNMLFWLPYITDKIGITWLQRKIL